MQARLLKLATQFIGPPTQLGSRRRIVEGQTGSHAAVGVDLDADVDTAETFGGQSHLEPGRAPAQPVLDLGRDQGGGLDRRAGQGRQTKAAIHGGQRRLEGIGCARVARHGCRGLAAGRREGCGRGLGCGLTGLACDGHAQGLERRLDRRRSRGAGRLQGGRGRVAGQTGLEAGRQVIRAAGPTGGGVVPGLMGCQQTTDEGRGQRRHSLTVGQGPGCALWRGAGGNR